MEQFAFQIPTKFVFGAGTLESLSAISLPGQSALIVTGGHSIENYGYLETLLCHLKKQDIKATVYKDVIPNPVVRNVNEARRMAASENCDFIIGFGGGSSVDTAKAVAAMVNNPGDLWDYVQVGKGGRKEFANPAMNLVAIPTTAGTGTEANPTAVITNENTGEKVGIRCGYPQLSLIDPDLTRNISPKFTAFQGFDALYHCLEAYVSKNANAISDPLALEGFRLIFENLPEAIHNGSNLAARSAVSWGATLGGMVICLSSCTSAHNIEHSLSGIDPSLMHGEGLIMISDAFHRFGARFIPERYARLAEIVGVTSRGKSASSKANDFLDALAALKIACGVGGLNLTDHGFSEEDIIEIIKGSHVIAGGPFSRERYEITDDDLFQMLQDSMG